MITEKEFTDVLTTADSTVLSAKGRSAEVCNLSKFMAQGGVALGLKLNRLELVVQKYEDEAYAIYCHSRFKEIH